MTESKRALPPSLSSAYGIFGPLCLPVYYLPDDLYSDHGSCHQLFAGALVDRETFGVTGRAKHQESGT